MLQLIHVFYNFQTNFSLIYPENMRKPLFFLYFQGFLERKQPKNALWNGQYCNQMDYEQITHSFHFCIFRTDKRRAQMVHYPTNIYLFKVNSKNFKKRRKICSKLTIKTPERRQWCRSGVFIINFKHISHLFLVFLLLNLNK